MADVIVYPWHGKPQRYVESGGYYAPQVSVVFDADGPIILNRFGLPERLTDNGDGTFSPLVTTTTDASDKLVHENGLTTRYSNQGDDTYCLVVATASLGGDDVLTFNSWGLAEKYVDLGDGTFALLANGVAADSGGWDSFGLHVGFDSALGAYSPLWDGFNFVSAEVGELWGADRLVWITDSGVEPSVWRI